jgi:SlyX protein
MAFLSEAGIIVSQEDRFVDIEIKLAHQEDLVESLNDVVYQQSKRIDQLEALVNKMAEHIRNSQQSGQNPTNDRPPALLSQLRNCFLK